MKCKNCSKEYNLVLNNPRILSCGHTFCLQCVSDMITDSRSSFIECPICGRATPIPPTVANNQDYPGLVFPENYTISETFMTIAPVPTVDCSMYSCSDPATRYCFACKKHLCDACAEFHNYFFPTHRCTSSSTALENAAYLEESLRSERDMMTELGRAPGNIPSDLPEIPVLAKEHERQRLENERLENERLEKERKIKEELERRRREQERIEREKAELERIQREQEERERREREERERIEREEQERIQREREEQERREREERERIEREERERIEREERERREREEQERLERERKEREELERKKREERAVLPHPWRQLVDRNTGKVFYFNKETKQKSDVRPNPDGTLPGCERPAVEQEQEQQQQQQQEQPQQQQGQQQQQEDEGALPPPPPPPEEDELPPDWIQLTDKRSGRKYYYNTVTKKTSWKRPTN